MVTTLSTITTDPHFAELETVFDEATKPIEWFMIAHNDPRMLPSLTPAPTGESVVILEISQDTWNFRKELSETSECALQQGEIKNVVLGGNSQACGAVSRALLAAIPKKDESGYAELLGGEKRYNAGTDPFRPLVSN